MITVTAAILIKEDLILIAKRKLSDTLPNKWEFPSGKIEYNETPKECLKRELKEEFNINVSVGDLFGESIFQYPDFKIKLIAYKVNWTGGKIKLISHDSYKWVTINNIDNYDFAEWLSKGGKDIIDNTIALCPNCHKKMHILNLKIDKDFLVKNRD